MTYLDHNKEPDTEEPDKPDVPRCSVCDDFEDLIVVDGKRYCKACFKKKFCDEASSDKKQEFIRNNVELWYNYSVESIQNDTSAVFRETAMRYAAEAFMEVFHKTSKFDFESDFCSTYAPDEFFEYIKGEVA